MNRFISQYVADLSCLSSCDYWLFFSFGIAFHKLELLKKLEKYSWLPSAALLFFIVNYLLFHHYGIVLHLMQMAAMAFIIFIVMVYQKIRCWLNRRVVSQLAFIGKNTLDVYIYHFFFVCGPWMNLKGLGLWFSTTQNVWLEFFFLVVCSVLIAYITIFVGKVIKELWISKIIYGKFF